MGSFIFIAMNARLRADCPAEVHEYFRYLSDDTEPHSDGVREMLRVSGNAGHLPDRDSNACGAISFVQGLNDWEVRISGSFNDDSGQYLYALIDIAGRNCMDGPFAMKWTQYNVADSERFVACNGVTFYDSGGGPLKALYGDAAPPVDKNYS